MSNLKASSSYMPRQSRFTRGHMTGTPQRSTGNDYLDRRNRAIRENTAVQDATKMLWKLADECEQAGFDTLMEAAYYLQHGKFSKVRKARS